MLEVVTVDAVNDAAMRRAAELDRRAEEAERRSTRPWR